MLKIPSLLLNFLPFLNPCIKGSALIWSLKVFLTLQKAERNISLSLSLSLAFRAAEHKRSYSSRDGVPHRDCNMFPVGKQGSVWTVSPAIPGQTAAFLGRGAGSTAGRCRGSRSPSAPGSRTNTPLCPAHNPAGSTQEKSCLPALSLRLGSKKIF